MFHSGIKFKGRYPILNLFLDYGGEPNVLLMEEGNTITSLPNDLRFKAQTYIPFRFNTGKFHSIAQPRIEYHYRKDIQYVVNEDKYRIGAHYFYLANYMSAYLRRGVKDILPRWGITTIEDFYFAPFNQIYGAAYRIGFTVYIPGILKHQTVKLTRNYQKQFLVSETHPALINLMSSPRGLYGIFGKELTRYSVDYVLPLLYPDLELSVFLYLKRIRGALWVDHMVGKNVIIEGPEAHYEDKNYTTMGFDLITDLHLLRISFPFSVGGRIIYEPETGQLGFEWIYSIDIN